MRPRKAANVCLQVHIANTGVDAPAGQILACRMRCQDHVWGLAGLRGPCVGGYKVWCQQAWVELVGQGQERCRAGAGGLREGVSVP